MTAAAASAPSRVPGRSLGFRIAMAGVAGAAVDFLYASGMGALGGRGIVQVWQGVAGGWLGRAAGEGGLATMALGLLTHVGIATAMAGTYALAAMRLPVLYRRPVMMGALYGIPLYLAMYRLVLPLRWPAVFPRWDGVRSVGDIAAHVGVGLAIALVLSRTAGGKSA